MIAVAVRDHGAIDGAMRIDDRSRPVRSRDRRRPDRARCRRRDVREVMSYLTRETLQNGRANEAARRRSGDDVGKQLVLDLGDAVFEDELLLFQPLDEKLVSRRVAFKGHDFAIELAVLAPASSPALL